MARSLSNLANNLSEGIHKIRCKYEHNDKIYRICGATYKVSDYFLEYTNFNDDVIAYKYLFFNKSYQQV